MKFTSTLVPALIAATVTTVFAQNAASTTPADPARPGAARAARPGADAAGYQASGAFRNAQGAGAGANFGAGANPARNNAAGMLGGGGMGGIGGVGGQTSIDRIMTNEEAIVKTGIDKAKFDEIKKSYKEYNGKIEELQKALVPQSEAQAKLVAEKGSEEDVGAAVEALWKTRAEIAKLQAFKALKTNKLLTTEELAKIREVDMEIIRARIPAGGVNRPGAPEGAAPGGFNRPNRPTAETPAPGAASGRVRGGQGAGQRQGAPAANN